MKTRGILITIVLLVSLFGKAQSASYTFSMYVSAQTWGTVVAQPNTIVFNKGASIPSNSPIYFLNYTTSNDYQTHDLSAQFLQIFGNDSTITTTDYTVHIGATSTSFTLTNINYLTFRGLLGGGGYGDWGITVQYQLSAGIANFNKKQDLELSIYPNPSTDKVNIKLNLENDEKKVKIILYSIMGQLVFKDEYMPNAAEPHELNVDKLNKGIYSLQVLVDGKSSIQNILIE